MATYGLAGVEDALSSGLAAALGGLDYGIGQGVSALSPYTTAGAGAFGQQAALSGALGAPAQQTAYDAFLASPGQQYLLDQAEQSILRNAAATGGLGGGNVLRALQENAIGLAAQDFGNQFDRLGSVAGAGLGAAGDVANLYGTGATTAAGLTGNIATALGSARERAGEQLAGQYGTTSSALANLIANQGAGLSDALGAGGSGIAGLLSGSADQYLSGLASLQAPGIVSTVSGLPGGQQYGGILDDIGKLLGGTGSFIGAL